MEKEKKILIAGISGTVLLGVIIFACILIIGGKKDKDEAPEAEYAAGEDAGSAENEGTSAGAETKADDKKAGAKDTGASKTDDKEADTKSADKKDAAKESGGLSAEITETGSWGESPVSRQMAVKIINGSSSDADGWKIMINAGDCTLDSGWNGNFEVKNGTLTVTNVDYNSLIPAGGNTEFGMILTGVTGDLSYTIEAGGMSASGKSETKPAENKSSSDKGTETADAAPPADTVKQVKGALAVPEPTTDDWLHTDGSAIYDSNGKRVWLTGVNWFGYNTGTNLFDGLWAADLHTSLNSIADHGFNLVRIPMSAELILEWKAGKTPDANYNHATNDYLTEMNSLEIFDHVIGQFRANGLKVMIDIHSAQTDASGHMTNLWYTEKISAAQYREALSWMAARYKDDDTIIAFDLKNEPHGKPSEGDKAAIWNDSTKPNNWKHEAELAAEAVLKENPNVLIMVEGTEIYPTDIKTNGDYSSKDDKDYYFNWWGGNLRGVADYPVDLGKYQDKLVYSPHDYGPTVYEQPWFKGDYTYDSLMKDCWHDNWLYIVEEDKAPLLIGEWGGFMRDPNLKWMTYMRELIGNYHLNHTFWCFNANSGDTGGLVKDDFTTWDTEKYNFVKEVLWQENGKFVGLDHKIPLGSAGNGICLDDAKGLK